jgi:hypothetical protein
MISSVRWSTDAKTWDNQCVTEDKKCTTLLQLKHKGVVLICYCRKVFCRKDDVITWLAVFAPEEGDTDRPDHADLFPFPFQLPLYPKRDLFFVKYNEAGGGGVAAPFLLGPAAKTEPVEFGALHVEEWAEVRKALAEAASDPKAVYESLQAAFDSTWVPEHDSDDEFVADEEVETDLLLLQSAGSGQVAAAAAGAAGAVSLPDDDWNDDEEPETDANTGFVVDKDALGMASDGVPSDSDEQDDDDGGSSDEDDVDDPDVDEDLGDDEDDAGDLDCSGIPL